MAWSSQSMISANIRVIPSHKADSSSSSSSSSRRFLKRKLLLNPNTIRAAAASSSSSSNAEDDCNVEECAPDKEVGKVSMEWLAGEKTKVVGTYPPRKKGWTGYVEKDTAGQTNIYSVEPAVYVAESAISSGTAGISSDGAENTAAIVAGLALISIAAASAVLLQVNKNPPSPVQTLEYSGPSLSYYINKFKPIEIVEASSITTEEPANSSVTPQLDISAPEVSEISSEVINQEETTSPISNVADVS